tara:strand:+ start:36 stop:659 length:624 start_codon:yes stop_codon:yes gene_type:complete
MRIKNFDKLDYKSHLELYWCDGEEVLELIKYLIEFVQETKNDDKVYFMLQGEFSGQDYQYYPDEVLDSTPSKVISEWDDDYGYADVGDCSKEFFDETQPIIDADGSIYSIDVEEYNTKKFKVQALEYLNKLYNKYKNEYENEEDIEIDSSELWYGLMENGKRIESASFWCDDANQPIKWCRAYEIEEDIYSVFTIGNDSEVIFVENQ